MNKAQKEILAQRIQNENKVLEELKEMYGEALDQVDEYIKNLIESNKDDELLSKIYQQHYQEALKKQIEDIIQKLEDNQYQTVNDYIHDCYDNGYVGVMYDLQYQGIPITTPINQIMVVKAIENDTKLSKSLYQSLDMSKLKKDIRSELSRGIVTSSGYDVIATNISLRSKINLSNASRIARTEGHRVQNQAALDAMTDAKDEGADIVKQWDSTLDGNTRESHKILDGQIREIDDYFEVNGHRGKIPGGFGVPGEDINCRCAVLQRAKWALGADELKRLEERAKYFGLDKAKDFSDFRDKYSILQNKNDYISIVNDELQFYKPVTLDRNNQIEISRLTNIRLSKVDSYKENDIYISDNVHIKRKQLANINKRFNESLKIVKIDETKKPKIMIISEEEIGTGAIAAYNFKRNIMFVTPQLGLSKEGIERLTSVYASSENPLSTILHEMIHCKNANDYREKNGDINNVVEYIDLLNYKAKKELDELNIQDYNVNEISIYAGKSYRNGKYDETITEYKVKKMLSK